MVLASGLLTAAPGGTIRGVVLDPSGALVPGAEVTLENHITGYRVQSTTDAEGKFQFFNVPENPYVLSVVSQGFRETQQRIHLHSALPVEVSVKLDIAEAVARVDVHAEGSMVEEHRTGTAVGIDRSSIQRFPAPVLTRGMEAIVLSVPGFIADENGRFHFRGSHGQVSYVVDGVPITDQLHVTFSNSLDPRMVESMEVVTGNIPAEFGQKAAAVVNLTTRSGLGTGGPRGSVMLGGGSFATAEQGLELFGGGSRFGYFLSAANSTSGRFLDPVNFDNFHNHGNTQRIFGRFDFSPDGVRNFFHLNVHAGRTANEVPNLLSQEEAGQDQRRQMRDLLVSATWLRLLGAKAALTAAPYFRTSSAQLDASPFDTPVTAQQDRRLATVGARVDLSADHVGHRLKTGLHFLGIPLREAFVFGITNEEFNDPEDEEFNPNLEPFDLTRGGSLFLFRDRRYGQHYSWYVQDSFSWKELTLNAGLRFDSYRLLVRESGWQPRVGLAYHFPRAHTVVRASYDRLMFTPANENLLLSSSPQAAALVSPETRELLGTAFLDVRSERQNSYEIGVQQGFSHFLRLDASYYTKDTRNIHDNDQFLNTGILFPVAISTGKIRGFDFRFDFPEHSGWQSYVSLGSTRAVVTPPFSGGLFLGEEAVETFAAGPFHIDHDQKLSAQWGVEYRHRKRWFTSLTGRHDSGLVTEIHDLDEIRADPDLAFGLDFVDLESEPHRVKARTVWNWMAGATLFEDRRHRMDFQLTVLNLANRRGLFNFLSVFGGTHVIPPRTVAARLVLHF
jgi:hypothetical protein